MATEVEEEVATDRSLDEAMTESIRGKLAEINARPLDEETASVTKPEETVAKVEKPRDETGKFAKVKDSAVVAEQPHNPQVQGAIEQATAEPEAPLVSTTGQPLDITRPPASWKPAAKAQWSALAEPIRAEIYRRESDFLNGNKGLRENADFGQTIKQTVEPYRLLIEAEGGTPERAIADTLRTAALFRVGTPQQKLDTIFALDKQFNAGLANFINQQIQQHSGQIGVTLPQPQAQPAYQDPRVDQILASLQQQERERSAQLERTSNSAVEHFIAALDEQGQPLYPFVDNVLDDMSGRVGALRRANPAMEHMEALKQAYDAAVWANPETRAVLLSQQQAKANQQGATLQKVEQAKRASATNVPKRGALPATGPVQSLDDTIRETGRALGMF